MVVLERSLNSQPLPPIFFCLFSPPPFHPFLLSPFSHPCSPSLHFFFLYFIFSLLTFSLLPHISLPCALFSLVSFSSRVFTQLLLPWLESLPQLLVDLGHSTPPLSAFIIDTLASAAPKMSLTQLEQHLLTLLGMGLC